MSTLYYLITLYLRGVRIPLLLPQGNHKNPPGPEDCQHGCVVLHGRPGNFDKQKKTGRFVQFELSLGGFGDLYNQESYIRIQNSTYIYVCDVHSYMYVCVFVCSCVCVVCMHVCVHPSIYHLYVYLCCPQRMYPYIMYLCMYLCLDICIYFCTYLCICLHLYLSM